MGSLSAQSMSVSSVFNVLLPKAAYVLAVCCCWLLFAVLNTVLDLGQKFWEIPLTVYGIPLIHAILYGAPKKQRGSPAESKIPLKQFPLKEIRLYSEPNMHAFSSFLKLFCRRLESL